MNKKEQWFTVVWVGGIIGWVYRPLTKKEYEPFRKKKRS
jgi:hypothetical protein